MYPGANFLLQPIFLRGFSASVHLALFLGLFVSFLWKKFRAWNQGSAERFSNYKRLSLYKQTLFCCFGVSVFNLILCLLCYFYWHRNGWSDEKLMTLLDFSLRTFSWFSLCVYLRTQFLKSGARKLPCLLRLWWVFYLAISCHSIVVDFLLYYKHLSSHMQDLASDVVSVFTGLLLCSVGFLRNETQATLLADEQPLLNGDPGISPNLEVRGGDFVTPYANAGPFSSLTFYWIGSLISFGNKKTLDLDDVPELGSADSVVGAFAVFRNNFESERRAAGSRVTTVKLVKALFLSCWKDILWTAVLAMMYTSASYVGPYLIDAFVQCLEGQGEYKNQGYILALTFFLAKLVECVSQRHWFFRLQQIGIRLRAVTTTMIYNKGLTLSSQSKQQQTSGEIINIMTVDVDRVGVFSWYMHDLWLIILQVGLALLILYKNLGLASVVALVATIVVVLINYPLGRLQKKFQDKLMESKDKRMKATTEILRNMRILKLQAWEMKFLSKIVELREVETRWLKKVMYIFAMVISVFWFAPTFIAVATFGACMLIGIPLESGKILSALATFKVLQAPIFNLPDTTSIIIQTKVSLDRISSFLCIDDLQPDVLERVPVGSSDTAIEIVDGNFSWDVSSPNATLKDVNFKVLSGMRVAVCGIVGSGKSSLLSCILGEMSKISGTLKLCGSKAYVAQSPWIQSAKIEENILFGKEMRREWYERVLVACSLKKDLEILPNGDQTVRVVP